MGYTRKALKKLGWTEAQIFNAELKWNKFKIRILPELYYESEREYVEWHQREVKRAHAIRQRIRQLNQPHGEEVYNYNLHPDLAPTATSGRSADQRTSSEERTKQDICRLRAEWHRVNNSLITTSARRPMNPHMWIYVHYWRVPANKPDLSRLWYYQRQACADRGGCCARTCGCCEKMLHQYQSRNFRLDPKNGEYWRKLYGHCTSECACCVITHGIYEPDPRLPRPWFVAEGGAACNNNRVVRR
ncbi:hypothetical protein BJX70DRAFT_357508 [Aspergillus crustosus]